MSNFSRYYTILFISCTSVGLLIEVIKLPLGMEVKLFCITVGVIWLLLSIQISKLFLQTKEIEDITYNKRVELVQTYGAVEDKPNIENNLNAKTIAYHMNQKGLEEITHDKNLKLEEKEEH